MLAGLLRCRRCGRLSVRNWSSYTASAQRLVDFTEGKVVTNIMGTHIVGTHIEQMKTPFFRLSARHAIRANGANTARIRGVLKEATPGQVGRRRGLIIRQPYGFVMKSTETGARCGDVQREAMSKAKAWVVDVDDFVAAESLQIQQPSMRRNNPPVSV
jgi:hypothetical protein